MASARTSGAPWPPLIAGLVAGMLSMTAAAQPPPNSSWTRLGTEKGLSHNAVLCMLADRDGYLWFGTLDGLNRWDGADFVVLRHDPADRATLSNNIVRSLLEDRQGRLWIGTQTGVDRLVDPRLGVERYSLAQAPVVHAIVESAGGQIWLGTSRGLFRYLPAEDRFDRALLPGDGGLGTAEVLDLKEEKARETGDGVLWLLVADPQGDPSRASLVRFAARQGRTRTFALETSGRPIYTLLIDRRGTLWLDAEVDVPPGLPAGGVHTGAGRLAATPVWALFEDRDGRILVGSEAGLRLDPGLEAEPAPSTSRDWLQHFVLSIAQDQAGALWIGTLGGAYRQDASAKPFVHLRSDPRDPVALSSDAISALLEDEHGQIWLGSYGGGLDVLGPDLRLRDHFDAEAQGLCDDLIWSLHRSGGRLYLGTESGLCSLDPASRRGRRHPLPIPVGRGLRSRVTRIAETGDGRLWLGTFNGLVSFDPATGAGELLPPTGDVRGPSDREISSLLAAPGALWIGNIGDTFDRLELATGRFEHHRLLTPDGAVIRTEGIFDLERTGDGLWLATGAGLHRLGVEGSRAHYSTRDGLPGSVVYSLASGSDGALWLGTNRGLARLDGRGEIHSYSPGDGVGGFEFNRGAALSASDGRLYFGGVGGLTVFDPRRVESNPFVPPVVLTRIHSHGRDGDRDYPVRSLERLVLPPGHSTVTFHFAALSFRSAAENRHAHRLEGFDPEWIEAGTARSARYTQLPPGDYVFRVRGSNSDGVWNLEGLALPVRVEPTFWQSTPVRLALGLLVLALLAGAYRYRVRSLLAVERLRLRVASDLHDDLSSELSAVALLADVMTRQHHLPDRDRSRLAEMRGRALSMVDALRDIVWYVNPEHDTLEATVRRARTLARSLLPEAEITFEANLPERQSLSMRARRELYLLMKEAFHNIARHARARRVEVELGVSGRSVDLVISDDGRGFDPAEAAGGDGLRNMRRRAARLGAHLEITSSPGAGTRIELAAAGTADGRWREFGMGGRGMKD